MKKWQNLTELKIKDLGFKSEDLINLLLENRGIKTKKDREDFLHPQLESVTTKSVGIDSTQLKKALKRIKEAIDKKEQIIIFGDYDVDGITGSAILWETLHKMGANVLPYIPHRVDEGYGLSVTGVENVSQQVVDIKLIITVDNGIMAHETVKFVNEKNIDVIITDHHTASETIPDAYAIVHTTKLCGAGVAYLLSQELKSQNANFINEEDKHLELATLGTVADMVPLTGANRAIVKHGLKKVARSKRLGLRALYEQAGLTKEEFTPYDIGFVIAPRLNASGRIESAMDSLRLLCTTNKERAAELAAKLELINKERQLLLREAREHAIMSVNGRALPTKLLVVAHESYAQGIIGLVAGKLVEEFYRPAIVLSIGQEHTKASARSITGFNIIEFLWMHIEHFVNVGGHPMAAGFTVETKKLALLTSLLEKTAEAMLTEEILTRSLKIDCEIPFSFLSKKLYDALSQLAPFGMGNPEPVFATTDVEVVDIRVMGKEGNHLKLQLRQDKNTFEAVGFGMGQLASELSVGDTIDVAYALDENTWRGTTKLQLMLKDIRLRENTSS